jgi:hypothetical protein
MIIYKLDHPKLIGNTRCYWYNSEGIPRITIGPTWGFTIPILVMITVMLYCYITGLLALQKTEIIYKLGAVVLIISNMGCFLYTLLANQGIPRELFVEETT